MLLGEMLKSLAKIAMTQAACKCGGRLMTDIMGYALLVPAGTPKDITARIARRVAKIMADGAVKERIVSLGGDSMGLANEDAGAILTAERARWTKVFAGGGDCAE